MKQASLKGRDETFRTGLGRCVRAAIHRGSPAKLVRHAPLSGPAAPWSGPARRFRSEFLSGARDNSSPPPPTSINTAARHRRRGRRATVVGTTAKRRRSWVRADDDVAVQSGSGEARSCASMGFSAGSSMRCGFCRRFTNPPPFRSGFATTLFPCLHHWFICYLSLQVLRHA